MESKRVNLTPESTNLKPEGLFRFERTDLSVEKVNLRHKRAGKEAE